MSKPAEWMGDNVILISNDEAEAENVILISDDEAVDEYMSVEPHKEIGAAEEESEEMIIAEYPLLQRPFTAHKVYSRIDLTKQLVWKGPYNPRSLDILCSIMK